MLPSQAVKNRQGGFSLFELLVALAILAIVATLVGPRLFGKTEDAKAKVAKVQIEDLVQAIDLYRLDTGDLPENLNDLRTQPGDVKNWAGPYLRKAIPKDPWDRDFIYRNPGEHDDFDVLSYGKDGSPGGEDNNADIGSWQ